MTKIPTHKIPEKYQTSIAFLRYFSGDEPAVEVDYTRRDEYYFSSLSKVGQEK